MTALGRTPSPSVRCRHPLLNTLRGLAIVAALAPLGGCAASATPAPVVDGSYRLYATSDSSAVDSAPAASLQIVGDDVQLTQGAEGVQRTLGEPAAPLVVCPPSGRGSPVRLDAPVSVGGVQLSSPALVGDCGQAAPVRVTLVDLDSTETSLGFPFTRWAEFCDLTDPDC